MARSGSPSQLMRPVMSAELVQHPVEDAEGRVEHPLPGEGRQHGRDDEGQQDEGAGERLALEIAIEQHRQPQPERQLEDGGDARIEERVVDGGAEDPVVPDLVVVGEADEVAGHAHARAGHRQHDAAHERVGDEHAEQHHGRHQQHERQPALVLEQPLPPRRRRVAERGGDRAYCHARSLSAGTAPPQVVPAARRAATCGGVLAQSRRDHAERLSRRPS